MEKRYIIFIHILIGLLSGLILYISIKPLIDVSDDILITDAIISGFTLAGLIFLLKNTIKYNHFSALTIQQKIINYSALAVLFAACWLTIEYFILYILFPKEEWIPITSSITIRIVIALLVCTIMILIYNKPYQQENEENELELKVKDVILLSENIIDTEVENKDILERIAVKNGQKIDVVLVSDIIHLQAEGDYVMIHSNKGKFLKEQTMKSFENGLPADKFVRVHRSSIVNIDFIAQIELYDKQSQLLKLKNGTQVKISLTGYKALKKVLGL